MRIVISASSIRQINNSDSFQKIYVIKILSLTFLSNKKSTFKRISFVGASLIINFKVSRNPLAQLLLLARQHNLKHFLSQCNLLHLIYTFSFIIYFLIFSSKLIKFQRYNYYTYEAVALRKISTRYRMI